MVPLAALTPLTLGFQLSSHLDTLLLRNPLDGLKFRVEAADLGLRRGKKLVEFCRFGLFPLQLGFKLPTTTPEMLNLLLGTVKQGLRLPGGTSRRFVLLDPQPKLFTLRLIFLHEAFAGLDQLPLRLMHTLNRLLELPEVLTQLDGLVALLLNTTLVLRVDGHFRLLESSPFFGSFLFQMLRQMLELPDLTLSLCQLFREIGKFGLPLPERLDNLILLRVNGCRGPGKALLKLGNQFISLLDDILELGDFFDEFGQGKFVKH